MAQQRPKPRGFSVATTRHQASSPRRAPIDQQLGAETAALQHADQLFQQGDLEQAERLYRQLIAAGCASHHLYANLAALCSMQQRWHDSIPLFEQALCWDASEPSTHNNLGVALRETGQLDAAIASFQAAIALRSSYGEAHRNLGLALLTQGNTTAAIQALQTYLQLEPAKPAAHLCLGLALQREERHQQAVPCYTQALSLQRDLPEAHYNLGIAWHQLGDLDQAINAYRQALQLKPDFPEALNNLGLALQDNGQLSNALAAFEDALTIKPQHIEALINCGTIDHQQGNPLAAIEKYERALELNPQSAMALSNLGLALHDIGSLTRAINTYRQCLRIKPDYPAAQFNYSRLLLQTGDYMKGWNLYESRFLCKKKAGILNVSPSIPRWQGEPLSPATPLLVVCEQGLGDSLQFMRYIPYLRAQGIKIFFYAQENLHSLIRDSGIDADPWDGDQAEAMDHGVWAPLLSLPRLLEVSPTNPIVTNAYLQAPTHLVNKWSRILAPETRPIIGINWQGNPEHETFESRGRSLPLEAFAPLARKTAATFLSLQKGPGSEQLQNCSFRHRFVECQDHISEVWDFSATAAIMKNCDLIISSDTAAAHLAAGLGQTTWLLLKQIPEWRWGLDGETTFWYPSMRLFRQSQPGDWPSLMDAIADILASTRGPWHSSGKNESGSHSISDEAITWAS